MNDVIPCLSLFYHCWCGGAREPVDALLAALDSGDFPGSVHLTLVGQRQERVEVLANFERVRQPDELTELERGWEPDTLALARSFARENPDTVIIYGHTHGSWHPTPEKAARVPIMIATLLGRWRECLAQLDKDGGPDVVGWRDPGYFMTRGWLHVETLSDILTSFATELHDGCWDSCPERAAADRFLLNELGWWRAEAVDLGRASDAAGVSLYLSLYKLPEAILAFAIALTAATFPGWTLGGKKQDRIADRLNTHFEPIGLGVGLGDEPGGRWELPLGVSALCNSAGLQLSKSPASADPRGVRPAAGWVKGAGARVSAAPSRSSAHEAA